MPKQEAKPAARQRTYRDDIRSEIVIRHGNITALDCDCVVNATNTTLLGGNGMDNSILREAGPELVRECAALKGCDIGRAKITGGYRLKAQFVIHTVGPKYSGDETDPVYLTMCYENCLNLAMKYDIHSIAFPAISTGYYGYPLRAATMIANRTVQSWMRRHPDYGIKVIFVSADERTFAMYKDIVK
ncbi:MAG: macro domain-containing protein [Lachnospiraceae bacterium]|nr:macro domain-containing protein [Lachnospiraceae bacterium]